MTKRSAFGNTWWSEQWLNALTRIDFQNRLPRGRAYANKGAVSGFSVEMGTIKAQVQGSRPKPYQIVIQAPQLSKTHTTQLLKEITQDPALIARLLNRELDPALLEKAKMLGIKLFPTSWQDLRMTCSCPDHAVPCKHLAAAIYLLSREIDSNPFLVFSLRGIDLLQTLRASGILMDQRAETPLGGIADRWPAVPAAASTADPVEPLESPFSVGTPDYSRIPVLFDTLLQLLLPSPPFYGQGDFRELYRRALERAGKKAREALATDQVEVRRYGHSSADRPRLALNTRGVSIIGAAGMRNIGDLASSLSLLTANDLPDVQPERAAMYLVHQTALHLLAKGAVIPHLFMGEGKVVELRWLPTTLHQQVRVLIEAMAKALPMGLAGWSDGKKCHPLAPLHQAECLCSLFLDHFIHQWSGIETKKSDKSQALFFGSGTENFNGPGEGSTPAGIHAWLSRLYLNHQDHLPVLCLDEGEGHAFSLTLAIEKKNASFAPPVPLQEILSQTEWAKIRYDILQTISLLADFFAPLNTYVSQGAKVPMRLGIEDLAPFLLNALPILRFLGIRVLLPKSLEQLRRPRVSMQIKGKAKDSLNMLSAEDVFNFDWKVAVGDHLLSRTEFEKLLKSANTLVRFKGEYVYLDAKEIEHLRSRLANPPNLAGSELLRIALAGEFAGATLGLDNAALQRLKQLTDTTEIPIPKSLTASLRPYQARGFAWLYRNARMGLGSVIADDMGLGKTLQVIAAVLKLKEEKLLSQAKVLIIVPTTLLTNWQKELTRFAPRLSVSVFHGAKRELPSKRPDILLTTFGVARTASSSLQALAWKLVVIDEAQNIKNPAAAQTKAAKAIPADSYIAMSGTPVENRLSEMWSIMDFANRGFLGSLTSFVRDYATPIQREHDQAAIARFKKVTAPFLLRRLKSDKTIIADLPDKIEQDQYCMLSKQQTALYQSVVEAGLRTIAGESDTFKRQGLVLQMIMALKQICNHPYQYLKQGGGEPQLSGKAERLLELQDEMLEHHEKTLVFTQFREMGTLLSQWMHERYGREPLFLHGGVSRAKRDDMVERFQQDRTERIFILSLKAGGTGLNLTAASNVVHYDLWWNPAVEAQATDRAYRIGQQHNVQVHRLVTRGTFEEKINDMIRSKKALADLTVGVGEQWIGNLSTGELKAIFAYDE